MDTPTGEPKESALLRQKAFELNWQMVNSILRFKHLSKEQKNLLVALAWKVPIKVIARRWRKNPQQIQRKIRNLKIISALPSDRLSLLAELQKEGMLIKPYKPRKSYKEYRKRTTRYYEQSFIGGASNG